MFRLGEKSFASWCAGLCRSCERSARILSLGRSRSSKRPSSAAAEPPTRLYVINRVLRRVMPGNEFSDVMLGPGPPDSPDSEKIKSMNWDYNFLRRLTTNPGRDFPGAAETRRQRWRSSYLLSRVLQQLPGFPPRDGRGGSGPRCLTRNLVLAAGAQRQVVPDQPHLQHPH